MTQRVRKKLQFLAETVHRIGSAGVEIRNGLPVRDYVIHVFVNFAELWPERLPGREIEGRVAWRSNRLAIRLRLAFSAALAQENRRRTIDSSTSAQAMMHALGGSRRFSR